MRVHHSLWISSLCSSPRVLVCDSRRGLTQHTAESSGDGCQGNVKPFLQDSSLLATAKDTHLLSITLDIWLHLHEQAQGGGVETCKNMYCTLSVRKRDGLSGREGNESKNTKQRKEERSPAVFRSTERERERERDWDLKSLQSVPLHWAKYAWGMPRASVPPAHTHTHMISVCSQGRTTDAVGWAGWPICVICLWSRHPERMHRIRVHPWELSIHSLNSANKADRWWIPSYVPAGLKWTHVFLWGVSYSCIYCCLQRVIKLVGGKKTVAPLNFW